MHSVRHWMSFFVGLAIFVLGFFPMIGKGAWLGPLDATLLGKIAVYIIAFGGLYVIFDSFFEYTFHSTIFIASFLVGLLVFGIGIVNILAAFKVITFSIPLANKYFYSALFMLEGLFLMLGCFVMD